ncbi:CD109 antigen-like [Babylonia areolata]|uniref:CD109 antigen-like n=1 Tax=Babylonia areolata TaxID=304850 RepID=UPI003FD421FB
MTWLIRAVVVGGWLLSLTGGQDSSVAQSCLLDNSVGCALSRPPQYMVLVPRRVRPNQVIQCFVTILRMEFDSEFVNVRVSIVKDNVEYTGSSLRFNRPSSRLMQLQMPSNAQFGNYRLRVEGSLDREATGNIFVNETDIEFSSKQASLFIQMSQPIYRQGQTVHFRIVPIQPDLMPNYGSMTIYVEDSTGIPVRRWLGLQTNAGGLVSQSFELSDQPNFGTWNIRVEAFGHTYRQPFQVEDFWEPRFDVNVTVPPYLLENSTDVIRGVMLANHTSGRPCKGNATITVFFRPRENVWNATEGWKKPYLRNLMPHRNPNLGPPKYKPIADIPVMDYYMYLEYDYQFIEYYDGRIDFEYPKERLKELARRSGEYESLIDSGVYFWLNVTDWYSGMNRTGWAGTIIASSDILLKWVGEPVRTFKPRSTVKVQVAVMRADGTPVKDPKARVTVKEEISSSAMGGSTGSQTRSPVNGIVEFEIYVHSEADSLKLTASYPTDMRTKSIEMRASRYYSPSDSYITIMTSTDHPKVNEYMIFHVQTSHFIPRIFYQVVAQGNIIIGDEIEMTSKQKTFAVALSREMIPTARLVVFYLRQPEEVVTDVLNFFVNGTRQNQVKLGINRGKDFTRDTVEFNAEADPGSYVAFSGMLLDLYNRGMNDGITENKLIDELVTYDLPANSTYRHLWRISDTDYEYKFFHGSDYGIDANTSFHSAGLLILTDAALTRVRNGELCKPEEDQYPCFTGEGQCYSMSQRCNGEYDACTDGADEFGCDDMDDSMKHVSAMDRVSRVMRFYDNSSWAWQEIFVKPDGRVDFRVDVPKYPLSWVINGLSMSRDLGLGIMTRPIRYDAARYMYIQVEHPQIIVRGEQVGVRVTVFNYWYDDDYLEVLITMHGSDNYEFVTVEELGWVYSYRPNTHKGDHQTIVFLEPGESKDIYMPIVPAIDLVQGKLTFHVSATCFMERDEYTGTMTVIGDGVMNYYHTPYLIDLIRFASIDVPYLDVPVPEQFVVPEVREHLYVPGSAKAMPSLFGDVVTPGFFEDYLNAENVLLRPYGGAEMITFNFAYNIQTLKFMKNSQQLPDDRLKTTLDQANIALQRVLSYFNGTEGSFHMFRDDPTPSMWLTAFVAKSMQQARFGEWEQDLFIPQELINKMVVYLCSKQNRTTGAWDPDPNTIYDRKMASYESIKTERMFADRIPLTAYILIALYATKDVSEDAVGCLDTARVNGASFLAGQVSSIPRDEVFHMAISTYALSFSQEMSSTAFKRLWSWVRNDSEGLYFADQKVPENPSETLTNERFLYPRQELMNDGYAVQSTAYALLALIKNNGNKVHRDSLMRWLNTMRNSIGGFASTQDTLVAMDALSEFTQVDPNRNVFDLMVQLTATATPTWIHQYFLKKHDYTTLYRSSIPTVWGMVKVLAQGTGRALMQLTTTVNVEYKHLMKPTQLSDFSDRDSDRIQFFDLMIDDLQWHGRNFSIMEMKPCVRWIYTERSLTSGLAVLEIDIPSGFIVMNDTLRDYVRSQLVPNLKRAEFYGRKVVFYFNYLDESYTCVTFRAARWYPVANATIQHRMRVYDYYEPGMHNTTLYTTFNLFTLNICYVCGSYQCPYCPYFNVATAIKATFTLLTLLLGVVIQRCYLLRS